MNIRRILMISCTAILPLCGCEGKAAGSAKQAASPVSGATPTPADLSPIGDKAIPQYQSDLLELAMDSATAIPVDPHIWDRSKDQEKAVEACLTLDQPKRAQAYAEKIADWRRGACYADLAYYFARHGRPEAAPRYLDMATSISKTAEDWCRDVIRVKIAVTATVLGKPEMASEFSKDVVDSEKGKIAGANSLVIDESSFDDLVKALDAQIAPGNFDILKNSLESYAQLYDRFYEAKDRRAMIEQKIKAAWTKMPVFVRIDLLESLADSAIKHSDQAHALELVNETQALADGSRWPLENKIPIVAKLAQYRYRSGDKAKAKADADAIFEDYKVHGTTIVNVFRGEALRPLAEAYRAMEDPADALSVYKKAVEEGYVNPNSRPRAEDLSATCVSMALAGVEPDSDLWARMRQIRAGLADPW